MQALTWFVVAIIFLIIELISVGLTVIWFAVGAAAAGAANLAGLPLSVQFIIFFGVSLALLIMLRPVLQGYVRAHHVPTNADRLIGETGLVTQAIVPLQGTGKVMVKGQEWSAKSENETIAEGSCVVVEKIEGVKLVVKVKEVMQ
ncbi:MAG: NfeD family protein [Eubacteriaceae bacterium]|jgi:membrane protein implicated in regulation of membrane protease activity|nr:NfeD family protein [Eubacteriaceae bacterium]